MRPNNEHRYLLLHGTGYGIVWCGHRGAIVDGELVKGRGNMKKSIIS